MAEEIEPNTEETAVEEVTAEVRLQRCLAVVQAQVARGLSVEQACEEAHISRTTFYEYVKSGVLQDYLTHCRDTRHQVASTLAAEAVPTVIQYMIRIATGQEYARGTPPHLAAEVVLNAAAGAMGGLSEKQKPREKAPVLQFFPETMTMLIGESGPRPATEEEILEGEEVTQSQE